MLVRSCMLVRLCLLVHLCLVACTPVIACHCLPHAACTHSRPQLLMLVNFVLLAVVAVTTIVLFMAHHDDNFKVCTLPWPASASMLYHCGLPACSASIPCWSALLCWSTVHACSAMRAPPFMATFSRLHS
ncbi:hypothetical protein BC831DRAFT_454269 [Entophlyctis helioformis]|nr:hypothetical protein BC831DRAFT_454269 [Entophlyctis helioformis]